MLLWKAIEEPDEGDLVGKAKPVMREAPALAELHEIFLGQAGGALELIAGKHYRCDTANAELSGPCRLTRAGLGQHLNTSVQPDGIGHCGALSLPL